MLWRRDGRWGHAVGVDLGLGWRPYTLWEWHVALQHAPRQVVGVEGVPERLEVARAWKSSLDLRLGGFELPVAEPVALIRAMNLLRDYPVARACQAVQTLGAQLLVGGWLLEGRTDVEGLVVTVDAAGTPTLHETSGMDRFVSVL